MSQFDMNMDLLNRLVELRVETTRRIEALEARIADLESARPRVPTITAAGDNVVRLDFDGAS